VQQAKVKLGKNKGADETNQRNTKQIHQTLCQKIFECDVAIVTITADSAIDLLTKPHHFFDFFFN
jgi:hypothetical protein